MTDDVDPRDDTTDSTTEAVRFGLDGIVHEIDLDPAGARALRAALAPYVAAGRRTTVTITPIRDEPARPAGAAPTGERAAAREWLEANGHKLGPGGRISATLMTLYRGRDGR
ncbi:Lsr2 dimerization domain-containing protein [Clavibacter phaseoli]|uniref:Lsr2 dimerization domain-containing protein n=1 Tax=Clavibacter phaseoli TaxID=1734031 RepID=UPI001F4055D8|nr:histone-like nucleoid-structuring protein Lsr2 [Clavibacter phaseoli]UKF31788.1 Lsr2 family protein [Clavibacter phaseoli]UKF37708.1 Lsr2 family protein [Clavibacter phaseoli]